MQIDLDLDLDFLNLDVADLDLDLDLIRLFYNDYNHQLLLVMSSYRVSN